MEGLVRSYSELKWDRDDSSIHDLLLDFENALMKLPYDLVSVLYEHGMKGESLRVIEQRTGVNRETLRRKFHEGLDALEEKINE